MTDTIDIKVPDLGDFSGVEVIEILVKAGDRVAKEGGLITLETDKAVMDVPAEQDGVIAEISVKPGDRVSSGDIIGRMEAGGGDSSEANAGDKSDKQKDDVQRDDAQPGDKKDIKDKGAEDVAGDTESDNESDKKNDAQELGRREKREERPAQPAAEGQKGTLPAASSAIDEAGFARAHASPSVRKLARELGVDLARVKGSGPKSRIQHEDVKAFVKSVLTGAGTAGGAALPKVPSIDFSKFGAVEVESLTRIQKISGPRLQASWINVPHVTQHDLADITDLEAKRQELKGAAKERGISLTPLAFVMRACVATLKEFPRANTSLSDDGESLVFKKYCHLGFAADTPNGLMVPVIRDADKKDVYEIAKELAELSQAARDGKLKAAQLQGASFTISSLGGIGGTAFTPIVNAPEVAILGVSRSRMQPVWDGAEFKPRLMLPLSLSYDHRVIDGAYAVRLTTFLAEALSDVDALLEAIP